MRLKCGGCLVVTIVPTAILQARRRVGLPYTCPKCGRDLLDDGKPPKRGKSSAQKRSQKQEKQAAKRYGGQVQPASGSGAAKGDVRDAGHIRMECKYTSAASYSLRLDTLKKIESEASTGEDPVLELEFQCVNPPKRYIIMPDWVYQRMLQGDG